MPIPARIAEASRLATSRGKRLSAPALWLWIVYAAHDTGGGTGATIAQIASATGWSARTVSRYRSELRDARLGGEPLIRIDRAHGRARTTVLACGGYERAGGWLLAAGRSMSSGAAVLLAWYSSVSRSSGPELGVSWWSESRTVAELGLHATELRSRRREILRARVHGQAIATSRRRPGQLTHAIVLPFHCKRVDPPIACDAELAECCPEDLRAFLVGDRSVVEGGDRSVVEGDRSEWGWGIRRSVEPSPVQNPDRAARRPDGGHRRRREAPSQPVSGAERLRHARAARTERVPRDAGTGSQPGRKVGEASTGGPSAFLRGLIVFQALASLGGVELARAARWTFEHQGGVWVLTCSSREPLETLRALGDVAVCGALRRAMDEYKVERAGLCPDTFCTRVNGRLE